MLKITMEENKQFIKEVKELLTSFSAAPTENFGKGTSWKGLENTFVHNSKVFGSTYIIVDSSNVSCYSVYVRFENDDMRKKYCEYMEWEQIHEKYNFHAFSKERIFHLLENLLIDLDITEKEYSTLFMPAMKN